MPNRYNDKLFMKWLIVFAMIMEVVYLIAGFWNPGQWALAVLFAFIIAIGVVELKSLNK